MSWYRRALLMVVPLLSGCIVLADGDSENKGRIIPDVSRVLAHAGDPTLLSCYVQGFVANFGWRKIKGQPTSEESLRKLTKTWRYNETYLRMNLYFSNYSTRDGGSYECWAKDGGNLTTRSNIWLDSIPHRAYVQLPVVALGANKFCVRWLFPEATSNKVSPELRIQYQENDFREWLDGYETTTKTVSGVFISQVYKQDTPFWFKFTLKFPDGEPVHFFSRWTKTTKNNEDPLYVPLVRARETTIDSITIEWPKPPLEVEDCFVDYRVKIIERSSGITKFIDETFTRNNYAKFENLTTSSSYKFHLSLCVDPVCDHILYSSSSLSEAVVPKDRDPKFTPNVSVVETGVASATIAWDSPPANLEDRIYYYKIALDTEYFRKELYVKKTENFYKFENLPLNKTNRFKVAACSDYKTQCGNWSEEREAFTRITCVLGN